ncbi:hypothetical protein EVAR_90357_1 [Eumeta japonica]|uniref:Uncharacterized protein n=1 Tax=Eumeta variegata TaxID=151549 RepID=A0A4C1YB52_EUMVA|nr:hypothetical protein EVAR_90357_1 [Eumeta japonica]
MHLNTAGDQRDRGEAKDSDIHTAIQSHGIRWCRRGRVIHVPDRRYINMNSEVPRAVWAELGLGPAYAYCHHASGVLANKKIRKVEFIDHNVNNIKRKNRKNGRHKWSQPNEILKWNKGERTETVKVGLSTGGPVASVRVLFSSISLAFSFIAGGNLNTDRNTIGSETASTYAGLCSSTVVGGKAKYKYKQLKQKLSSLI